MTLIIFILIPPVNQKHNFKLINTKLCQDNLFLFHQDLDNDGITEEYKVFYNSEGHAAFEGFYNNNKYIVELDLKGTLTYPIFIAFHDIDKNNSKDVIITTHEEDTLRLHIFNPLTKEILVDNLPLFSVKNKDDFFVYFNDCMDLNNNGQDEIIFILNAGFSLQPRKIISYEYATGTIKTSPLTGVWLGYSDIKDVNNDGKMEFLIQTYSTNNCKEPIPYSDTSSWSILFDSDLNIINKPVENPVPFSVLQNAFFKEKDGQYNLIMLIFDRTKNHAVLKKSNLDGNIIREIELPDNQEQYYLFKDKNNDAVYLFNANMGHYKIDSDFKFVENLEITGNKTPYFNQFIDINGDGIFEYASFLFLSNEIYITESLTDKPAFLQLPINKLVKHIHFSFPVTRDKKYNLYVQADTQGFYINYTKNKFYWTRYLIYLGSFAGLFILIEFVRWQQRKTIENNAERERKLVEWQLQSIRNQLDPHFTFNALNAIGSAIYQEKKEVAYDIFTMFSHLFRKSLEDGNKLTRTLKDELEFVKNYITIQKFRFQELFDFKIIVEKDVKLSKLIPKLVIQNFVENAIYHGLIPRKKGGSLNINIIQNKQNIVVTIVDNGVGRAATRDNKKSTGKGIELLQNYFDLLNKNNPEHLTYNIIDLYEGDKPAGTKVELIIPLNFKYS